MNDPAARLKGIVKVYSISVVCHCGLSAILPTFLSFWLVQNPSFLKKDSRQAGTTSGNDSRNPAVRPKGMIKFKI